MLSGSEDINFYPCRELSCRGNEYWSGNFWYCDTCRCSFNDCQSKFMDATKEYEMFDNNSYQLHSEIVAYRKSKFKLCAICMELLSTKSPSWQCVTCAPSISKSLRIHFDLFGFPSYVKHFDWWSKSVAKVITVVYITCFSCSAMYAINSSYCTVCPKCGIITIDTRLSQIGSISDVPRYNIIQRSSPFYPTFNTVALEIKPIKAQRYPTDTIYFEELNNKNEFF